MHKCSLASLHTTDSVVGARPDPNSRNVLENTFPAHRSERRLADMPYKLSATLKAHTSDVRASCSPTNELILSASRDSTAICWQRSSAGPHFTPDNVLRAGSRYLNAVTYIPPTLDAPKGYAVTGGQDTIINIFSLEHPKDDPDFSLLGHTENICALHATPSGTIISGSWDKTAKVWRNFALLYDLKGHQQSVWAVLALDEDRFLTGSADKSIRLWQQHKMLQTYIGHQDAVRGLALVPDIGFASCSNDSEIRVWTLGGDLVYTLSGHTSFVYSLSVLSSGDIISAGEDRTVRVWKDGECSQIITHPAISVWTVSSMPNGDIVSGCSDGIVRVFSASEDRWMSQGDLKEYDLLVASQALPSQQVGDVKKNDLPGVETLLSPGKKSGEVKMLNNQGIVEAHQWDAATSTWHKIGDVVDAVGQSRKQLYQGKEYDYVFDVDIQDGVPPLKLPYNATENPFAAAQRFLESNDLPLTYIDEVVRFIEKNTAPVDIGAQGEEYVDPYTGASRYRSTGSAPTTASASEYADPFTGASRYRGTPQAPSSSVIDPLNGASRFSGLAASTGIVPLPKTLPVVKYVAFKQANVNAMQAKLFQFDEAIRNEIPISSLALSPEEISGLNEIFSYLSRTTMSPPLAVSLVPTSSHVNLIARILERWPSPQRFPVIDLSRLLAGFCPKAFSTPGLTETFLETLLKASEWNSPWTLPLSKPRDTNTLLMLRTLANVFQEGSPVNDAWLSQLLENLSQAPYAVLSKNLRVALATVLFNVSCFGLSSPLAAPIRNQHLRLTLGVLESEADDSEAVYRAFVALGNVVYFHNETGNNIFDSSQISDILQCIRALPSRFKEDRVRNIFEEIAAML